MPDCSERPICHPPHHIARTALLPYRGLFYSSASQKVAAPLYRLSHEDRPSSSQTESGASSRTGNDHADRPHDLNGRQITLLALATLNPIDLPAPVVVLLAVVSTLVGLLVKGAIAAFYLRHAAPPTTGGEAQLRA